MFEEWKRVWRDAVENFQRELEDSDDPAAAGGSRQSAMRRDLTTARGEMKKLDLELGRALRLAQEERASEQACRRRHEQADRINDPETARLAAAFAERHAERAVILERKAEILDVERAMRLQDLHDMESAFAEYEVTAAESAADLNSGLSDDSAAAASTSSSGRRHVTDDDEFVARKMQRAAKERAAEAHLEELKKRMGA